MVDEAAVDELEEAKTCPVTVAVHVRPLLGEERSAESLNANTLRCSRAQATQAGQQVDAADRLVVLGGKHLFEFDYVYGSEHEVQGRDPKSMFSDCVKPLVLGLFTGYSATVLAYGQTGSGKTYTMGGLSNNAQDASVARCWGDEGNEDTSSSESQCQQRGIIPRAVDELYSRLGSLSEDQEVCVRVSYVEIYNEEIRDLLAESENSMGDAAIAADEPQQLQRKGSSGGGSGSWRVPSDAREIQIRESADGQVHLVGCTETEVTSKAHMAALFQKGVKLRSTSRTGMNKQSSRSHAIFTICVETTTKTKAAGADVAAEAEGEGQQGGIERLRAKINLVDLAGSERVKRTLAEGSTFREGVSINKGLLALGNVISALATDQQGQQSAAVTASSDAESASHVPYRDSKLTRILRDALGGNSKTVMIACVSPFDLDCDESVNTLRYAQRARSITNVITKDALDALDAGDCEVLREALARARAENALLKKQLCLCRNECSTLKSIIKFGTHGPTTGSRAVGAAAPRVEPAAAAIAAASRERIEEEEAESLQALESHVSKLDEALHEKELAMEKVRKGVSEMHQQIVESCGAPGLAPSSDQQALCPGESSAPESSAGDGGENGHEMRALVSTMEAEIGDLQVQKLELLQQLQEYAASDSSSAQVLPSGKRQGKGSRRAGGAKAGPKPNPREAKQKQALLEKVKKLESVLSELKKKHAKLVNLERLKMKSDALCDRLKRDVEEIKRQKCHLMKEISAKAKRFASYQKVTRKEMQTLQREKAKAQQARSKLEINKEKQTQALKRKTEECAKHKNKLRELSRKDSGRTSSDSGAKGRSKDGEEVPELQPNALAPLLRDERSRQVWIEEEMEACEQLEELRDSLKETHADTTECAQAAKQLKNRIRALERKVDRGKRKSTSPSTDDAPGSGAGSPELEAAESDLAGLRSQLEAVEASRAGLDERMAGLEADLARLMHERAACFMLTAHDKEGGAKDAAGDGARVGSREAHRFAKLLINGKNGMNANGMSSDLRRWSGLRSLAEARGMLRIVFSKAITSRIEANKSKVALSEFEAGVGAGAGDSNGMTEGELPEADLHEPQQQQPQPQWQHADPPAPGSGEKRKKKHSMVDPKWVDDILEELKEQSANLKELAGAENSRNIGAPQDENKGPSKSSQLARKALLKYSKTKEAISPKALSPQRNLGWAETQQTIQTILQARNI